jgi:hypothetical protein
MNVRASIDLGFNNTSPRFFPSFNEEVRNKKLGNNHWQTLFDNLEQKYEVIFDYFRKEKLLSINSKRAVLDLQQSIWCMQYINGVCVI